ncbi:PAS domain S-box-containing protein/diguanylate cyclase (GGDEF)-like protein [Pseudacidovorax intermedius]|uniref:PAS domain S-box-containing protein/diguanylate cyclase (GGDEF)-like protein n=1 Tax=Pseudacidovorax intermedius TaxID=433924 RepID=A0A370F365_9BURK|nr:PAS domain S-box-containing protein/diguanylate cyclase (GGDEF)-like protein [Pseudacidovorax intermedius]
MAGPATPPEPRPVALPRAWYLRVGAVVAMLLAGLTLTYLRADPAPASAHMAFLCQLLSVREADAGFDAQLLSLQAGRTVDDRALSQFAAQAAQQVQRMAALPEVVPAADRPALQQALGALRTALDAKVAGLPDFRRTHLGLAQAQAGLPSAAADLLQATENTPLQGAARRYVLGFLPGSGSSDEGEADAAAEALRTAAQSDPALAPAVRRLLTQGDSIHRLRSARDAAVDAVRRLDTTARIQDVQRRYEESWRRLDAEAHAWRIVLFGLAMLMAAYLSWAFLQWQRMQRQLAGAHGELQRRYQAQLAAEQRLKLHATAFENAYDGITLTDARGNIVDVNPAFCRITGYSRAEVIGRNPSMMQSGRHDRAFYTAMWKRILETGNWNGEIWNRNKYGEVYPELLSISAIRDSRGAVSNFVAVFADIRHLKAQEKQLARMAYYDALTGLPNRVLLADRLQHAVARARSRATVLAVCYMDLDNFKPVNDGHGHAAGDLALVQVARHLQAAVQPDDTVARTGGDEFVLLFERSDTEGCHRMLQQVVDAITLPLQVGSGSHTLTGSIGVTFFPQDDIEPEALLRHADQAMYRAKQAGGGRFHVFDAEDDRHARDVGHHAQRLRQAMRRGELVLYYQPKVDMRRGTVLGAEALIRWQHPERGLLPPGAFLPLLEDDALTIDLGEWVIEQALVQAGRWAEGGLRLPVSVNVASAQLQGADFMRKLGLALERHPAAADLLELEILETTSLDDVVKAARIIEQCHALGVHVSIDDFGTGYSSLTYLKRLPARTIKLDQSFVRELLEDSDNLVIAHGVIRLVHALDRKVIAEGVESEAHGRLLLQMGCDCAQGYGVARPMPAADLPDWVQIWQPPQAWRDCARVRWTDEVYPLLLAEVQARGHMQQLRHALQHGRRLSAGPTLPPLPELPELPELPDPTAAPTLSAADRLALTERLRQEHATVRQRSDAVGRALAQGLIDEARARSDALHAAHDELLAALSAMQFALAAPVVVRASPKAQVAVSA